MNDTLSPALSKLLLHYYFGPNHPLKIRFFRKLHQWLGSPRFILSYGERSRLALDMNDFIQFQIIQNGGYDSEVWEAVKGFMGEREVIWDIGAHVGSFGIRAADHPGEHRVFLFEPFPPVFAQLLANCHLNPHLTLTPLEYAVTNTCKKQDLFYLPSGNQGTASLMSREGQRISVEAVTVDYLVEEKNIPSPDILKIDAEDAEALIIEGMSRTLSKKPPKVIVFEGYTNWENAPSTRNAVEALRAEGYRVEPIPFPEQREVGNFIAVPC